MAGLVALACPYSPLRAVACPLSLGPPPAFRSGARWIVFVGVSESSGAERLGELPREAYCGAWSSGLGPAALVWPVIQHCPFGSSPSAWACRGAPGVGGCVRCTSIVPLSSVVFGESLLWQGAPKGVEEDPAGGAVPPGAIGRTTPRIPRLFPNQAAGSPRTLRCRLRCCKVSTGSKLRACSLES